MYLSAPPRVYRQVASLIGLQLVTSFISVAKTLSGQRETTQRQLNAEKKKQSDGPLIESLNNRLALTHASITYLEELMRKIFGGWDLVQNTRNCTLLYIFVFFLVPLTPFSRPRTERELSALGMPFFFYIWNYFTCAQIKLQAFDVSIWLSCCMLWEICC